MMTKHQSEKKHNFWHGTLHWFMRLLIISLVVISGISCYQIYRTYTNTLHWQTKTNALPLAQIPPDALNDTPAQALVKEKFLALYHQLYHQNGDISATSDQMSRLRKLLKQITTTNQGDYRARYDRLYTKYAILGEFTALFQNKYTLAADIGPVQVHQYLNKTAETMATLHQKDKHDVFVTRMMPKLLKLKADAEIIDQTVATLKTLVTVKSQRSVELLPDTTTDKFTQALVGIGQLQYHWPILASLTILKHAAVTPLIAQTDKIEQFEKFQADQTAKKNAYADWQAQRQQRQKEYAVAKADQEKAKQEATLKKQKDEATKAAAASSSAKAQSSSAASASSSPATLTVPSLIGVSQEAAIAWCTSHHVAYLVQKVDDGTVDSGTVIEIKGTTDRDGQQVISTADTLTIIVAQ